MTDRLETLVSAGLIHKQVQEYAKGILKPDMNLFELATSIEDKIKELTNFDPEHPKKGGVAFPTGLSINECAAHWSPNPTNTEQTLKKDDLLKIDFGVHINGHIIDGAFSNSFSEQYSDIHQQLIEISQDNYPDTCNVHQGFVEFSLQLKQSHLEQVLYHLLFCQIVW